MKTIAAQPFDFTCDPAHLALIVIDMQRDFIEPGGFGATLGNDVPAARCLPQRWVASHPHARMPQPDLSDCPPAKRTRGKPSLRIGDPGPMGRILIAGEPGADIVPELRAAPGEIVLDKPGKGAFYATLLGDILAQRTITHLVFAGVTTEVCVQTTMREANDRGFDGLLAEDATESYFPEFKKATLDMIRAQGAIVGWTATVEQIAAGLR